MRCDRTRPVGLAFAAWCLVVSAAADAGAQGQDGVCDRTPQVQQAIVRAAGVEDCGDVTGAHLSAVTDLNLRGQRITTLSAGDFSGLVRLRTLGLSDNDLTSLPGGIFAGLVSLRRLLLYDNVLTTLPESSFAGLPTLRELELGRNNLIELTEGIFAGLSSLHSRACPACRGCSCTTTA